MCAFGAATCWMIAANDSVNGWKHQMTKKKNKKNYANVGHVNSVYVFIFYATVLCVSVSIKPFGAWQTPFQAQSIIAVLQSRRSPYWQHFSAFSSSSSSCGSWIGRCLPCEGSALAASQRTTSTAGRFIEFGAGCSHRTPRYTQRIHICPRIMNFTSYYMNYWFWVVHFQWCA